MSNNILTKRIEAARAAGRLALIPFLPAGYPNKDRFWDEIDGLDASGADVIEIGMPFSDPVADGPVVEHASLKCLDVGVNLKWIISGLAARKGRYKAGLVLMGYLNPVLQYGLEAFARDAASAGVHGVILADVPHEEADVVRAAFDPHGLALIPLVGLNTTPSRMALYGNNAQGFAYFVSVLGTTGVRSQFDTGLPPQVREGLTHAKAAFPVPVALGFGLKHPDQLKDLAGLVDAAVFGSALIKHIDQGGDAKGFMKVWK
ncbi:MAG: tryptophan synthase subunit alpha [Humidesulfovibrio sp.]|uniref:tryptophan synthase subunit alpha n=1 Tax=Humidesulfovibrio sp. TaxID=2910988 RepID=UPI002735D64D|nr:tryptophan synthase subunit alpha [Humidesulfovibrio sp.]MDP2848278.1 tryptophan synthase subunit alpha [Humidesulfovibrio sp.]